MLIYIPGAYLPVDTKAVDFIFEGKGMPFPRQWKEAHNERCTKAQHQAIEALAKAMGTTKAGAIKYLILNKQGSDTAEVERYFRILQPLG